MSRVPILLRQRGSRLARWSAFLGGTLCALSTAWPQPANPPDEVLPESSRVGRVQVTCPCCAFEFEALAVARTNTLAGVDRDLFARALGPQPVFYLVSACPRCYYGGYLEDFQPGVSLPPDVVSELTGADSPLRPSVPLDAGTPQRDIPALVRYELAYECYRRLQRPDEALGRVKVEQTDGRELCELEQIAGDGRQEVGQGCPDAVDGPADPDLAALIDVAALPARKRWGRRPAG